MDLLSKSREFVLNNLSCEVDARTLEILTYAVFALFLTKEDLVTQKMPNILKNLTIYAKDKTILEIAHEDLGNYQEDNLLINSDACVTRSFAFDENGTFLREQRNLLLSLSENTDVFNLVFRVTHELIHLLRFGGVIQSEDSYKIQDGIATAYFNTSTGKIRRKHFSLEEGIVQTYANKAIKNLYEFLRTEKENSHFWQEFMKGFPECTFYDYLLEVSIIEALSDDSTFKDLIDESFYGSTTPAKVITYYNDVMNSSSAFTELSKKADFILFNMDNDFLVTQTILAIKQEIYLFLVMSKYQKKKASFS